MNGKFRCTNARGKKNEIKARYRLYDFFHFVFALLEVYLDLLSENISEALLKAFDNIDTK